MPTITKRIIVRSGDRQKGSPSQYLIRIPPTFKNIKKIELLYFSGFPSDELSAMVPGVIQPSNITSSGTQGVLYDEGVLGNPIIVTNSPTLEDLTVTTTFNSQGISTFDNTTQVNGQFLVNNTITALGPIVSLGTGNPGPNIMASGVSVGNGDINVTNGTIFASDEIRSAQGNIVADNGIISAPNGISLLNDLTIVQRLLPNQIRASVAQNGQFLGVNGGIATFRDVLINTSHYVDDRSGPAAQTVPAGAFYEYILQNAYIQQNDEGIINTATNTIDVPPNSTIALISQAVGTAITNFDMNYGLYDAGSLTPVRISEGWFIAAGAATAKRCPAALNCFLEGGVAGTSYKIFFNNQVGDVQLAANYVIAGQLTGVAGLSLVTFKVK